MKLKFSLADVLLFLTAVCVYLASLKLFPFETSGKRVILAGGIVVFVMRMSQIVMAWWDFELYQRSTRHEWFWFALFLLGMVVFILDRSMPC